VGNVTYSGFSHYSTTITASDIDVNFIPGEGVRFSAGWNTVYPASGIMDSVIVYTVTANDGYLVNSVGLTMGYPATLNDGVAKVSEGIWEGTDLTADQIGGLQVISDGSGPLADDLSDSVTFTPGYTQLTVEKNIMVSVSSTPGSFAAVTFVENWIGTGGSGQPPVIPEPASLVLLPLALAGLALRKKLAR